MHTVQSNKQSLIKRDIYLPGRIAEFGIAADGRVVYTTNGRKWLFATDAKAVEQVLKVIRTPRVFEGSK